MEPRSVHVAVIGAGMAGLVAARELQRENHDVVVFEKSNRVGGLWVYDPRTETDPMSLDPTREIVHSSMYHSLRTNLPRHVMDFLDYPFTPKDDPRTFPGREEVIRFLDGFAVDFELNVLIRFGSDVVRVERVGGESTKWVVEWRSSDGDAVEEVFDAVVVCNGHHTQPRVVEFPGRSTWPGKQLHSHNYRIPEPYKDKIVLIIGNGPSALDISNDIISFIKHYDSPNTQLDYKGRDLLLFCSTQWYVYDFPFLRTNDIVTVDDNRVGPVYKHVFPPSLAPNLSFIGLTYQPNVEMVMELQSKWVARVLSGKMVLPNEEQMMESVQEDYKRMEEMGCPKHHSHLAFEMENKFGYQKWLIDIMGLPPLEKWREDLIDRFLTHIAKYGLNCRDQWDADTQTQEIEHQESSNN